MENKVEVFIATVDCENNSLKELFDSKLFEVKTITINNPSTIVRSNFDLEAYRLLEIIKKSDPKKYCLYLKDNVITNTSKNNIRRITEAILAQCDWDLTYYGYWLDRCDLYTKSKFKPYLVPKTNSYLVRTFSPNGVQAILFSPKGKKILLGEAKMKNVDFHFNWDKISCILGVSFIA